MKLMFASDIHGSSYFCRKMLEMWKKEKAGRLILLGDLLYHGPRNELPKEYAPKEVISLLNSIFLFSPKKPLSTILPHLLYCIEIRRRAHENLLNWRQNLI